MTPRQADLQRTVVADPPWVGLLVWLGFPVLGAALGFGVLQLADLATSADFWVPWQGLFERVSQLPRVPTTIVAIGVGVIGGLVVAYLAAMDSLRVAVTAEDVTTTRGGTSATVRRAEVAAVYLDGKELVLADRSGGELAREKSDLAADELEGAFRAHGYPWRADDPYRDAFERWADDDPRLPIGANAVLKARQQALEQGVDDDVREFRATLARLGIVVRDEKKRQYWRPVN